MVLRSKHCWKWYQNDIIFRNIVSERNTKMVLLSETVFLKVIPKLYYFSKHCDEWRVSFVKYQCIECLFCIGSSWSAQWWAWVRRFRTIWVQNTLSICIYIYIYMCVCVHVSVYVCIYVCMNVHTYMYIYIYIYVCGPV